MRIPRFVCAFVALASAAVTGATVAPAAITMPVIDRALLAPIYALVVAFGVAVVSFAAAGKYAAVTCPLLAPRLIAWSRANR